MGSNYELTRRGFVKGMAAAGTAATLYGCGKGDDDTVYLRADGASEKLVSDDPYINEKPVYRYSVGPHNCGGQCILRGQITRDGRLVRILQDDSTVAYDGTPIYGTERNRTQYRPCTKCRSYKGRIYHPGRLKYPLKQTKQRGDISGFKRITWEQAIKELAQRFKAITGKYGNTCFMSRVSGGGLFTSIQGENYGDTAFPVLLGGANEVTYDYSFHQAAHMGHNIGVWYTGVGFTGYSGETYIHRPNGDQIAGGAVKYAMLWGTNKTTTSYASADVWGNAFDEAKTHYGTKVFYIAPELNDAGMIVADEWVQLRAYTDVALILGMIHTMLEETFDANGDLLSDPLLDVNHLDTLVHGFFASPEYWVHNTNRAIELTNPGDSVNYTYIEAVAPGKAYADYIIGNGSIKIKNYGAFTNTPASDAKLKVSNYVDSRYATVGAARIGSSCTYTDDLKVPYATSQYLYKREMKTPKNAEWASKKTGVPAGKIRELARILAREGLKRSPVYHETCGGQMKQAEGCVTFFAMETLNIIVNNWGRMGATATPSMVKTASMPYAVPAYGIKGQSYLATAFSPASWSSPTISANILKAPLIVMNQWQSAVRYAFREELKKNGYNPNIPEWKYGVSSVNYDQVYYDDGGAKAQYKWERNPDGTFKKDPVTGLFVPEMNNGKPVYAGLRFLYNVSSGGVLNQSPNSIDNARMLACLPSYGYDEGARTNVADEAESFCVVTIDNFLAPSAQFADYVLPASAIWEKPDVKRADFGQFMYMDDPVKAPGEALEEFDIRTRFLRAVKGDDVAAFYTGISPTAKLKDVMLANFAANSLAGTPFEGKTWEEFIERPFVAAVPSRKTMAPAEKAPSGKRAAYDTYLDGDRAQPFLGDATPGKKYIAEFAGYFDPEHPGTTDVTHSPDPTEAKLVLTNDGYRGGKDTIIGNKVSTKGAYEMGFLNPEACPAQTGKFHVYSGAVVWRYKNLYSRFHASAGLDSSKWGQTGKDREGDELVWPVAMYFGHLDAFRDSYGLAQVEDLEDRYALTTPHSKYRAHSATSPNPFLREITNRVVGGDRYSGNDAGSHANVYNAGGEVRSTTNPLIGDDGKPIDAKRASYVELMMNPEEMAAKGIKPGDLLKVSNEIGTVFCAASPYPRVMWGHVVLEEGAWFDPRGPINEDGVIDVGGNANVLMPSTPSRIDHGNPAQFAMVKVEVVNI